jgi:hypothetical protein
MPSMELGAQWALAHQIGPYSLGEGRDTYPHATQVHPQSQGQAGSLHSEERVGDLHSSFLQPVVGTWISCRAREWGREGVWLLG